MRNGMEYGIKHGMEYGMGKHDKSSLRKPRADIHFPLYKKKKKKKKQEKTVVHDEDDRPHPLAVVCLRFAELPS